MILIADYNKPNSKKRKHILGFAIAGIIVVCFIGYFLNTYIFSSKIGMNIIFTDEYNTNTLSLEKLGYTEKNSIKGKVINVDDNVLKQKLRVININRSIGTASKIIKEENQFTISGGVESNYIDLEKLKDYIKDYISKLETVSQFKEDLTIHLEDFYVSREPDNSLSQEIDRFNASKITYTNGENISLSEFIEYYYTDGKSIKIYPYQKDNLLQSIRAEIETRIKGYDTVYAEKKLKTSNGEIFVSDKGTYGDKVNFDEEANFIYRMFLLQASETQRLPIYTLDLPDEIGGTYIEISLEQQHLWYYENGELCMETDIVTGTKGKHDTPIGFYYVSEKINGKYLRGDDYVTWVDKWMRLTNSGIGLHDADWRSSFGGKIYTYNGSHGCINLPPDFAYELYDRIERKICVIIY